MKKFSEIRKTQTWEDLRFPLVWLPILSTLSSTLMIYMWSFYIYRSEYDLFDLFFSIVLGLGFAAISSVIYLAIPFIIRFLILRHPLKRGGISSLLYSFILSFIAKVVIIQITASKTGPVPILQIVAVYHVLVAGHEEKPVVQWDTE